jgi:hypothetical protein
VRKLRHKTFEILDQGKWLMPGGAEYRALGCSALIPFFFFFFFPVLGLSSGPVLVALLLEPHLQLFVFRLFFR